MRRVPQRVLDIIWFVIPYLPVGYVLVYRDMHSWWWVSFVGFSVIVNLGMQRIAYELRRNGRIQAIAIRKASETVGGSIAELST